MFITSKIPNNFPNLLTSLRFAFTPIFLSVFYVHFLFPEKRILQYFSILLFSAICLTDILDGYMARRIGIHSTFGMYFDVSADFVFRFSTLLFFSCLKILPFYLVIIYSIFFIEFIIITRVKSKEESIREISIFRKSVPVLYMLLIGIITAKDFFPDSILRTIYLSKISYVMLVLTLLAIVENLVFTVGRQGSGRKNSEKDTGLENHAYQ